MVFITWVGIKYVAGGESTWIVLINCLVHVFMFTYYLLTAFDSRLKNLIRIKRTITEIQLVS